MLGLAITDLGLEKITALEIKEILNTKSDVYKSTVAFKVNNQEDLLKFSEEARSIKRVLLFIGDCKLKDYDSLCKNSEEILRNFSFKEYFKKKTTFRVKCKRIGEHDFNSNDVELELGGYVIDKVRQELGFSPKVKMKDPDIVIYCHIFEHTVYLGIDISKEDLSKREYKLYSTKTSIRGNIAYGLVRMSEYKEQDVLLDPFADSGVIPIEAALFSKGRIYGCDGFFRNVKYSKSNAKIANVEVEFSKTDISFLSTKFDEKSVDCIVSYPPQLSKRSNKRAIEKTYNEFCKQCKHVLSEKGKLVILMIKTDLFLEIAKKHGLKVKEEANIVTGDMKYTVLKAKT